MFVQWLQMNIEEKWEIRIEKTIYWRDKNVSLAFRVASVKNI